MARRRTQATAHARATGFREFAANVKKKAQVLLRGLKEPREESYQAARDALNALVIGGDPDHLDPADELLFLLACELSQSVLPGYASLDYQHIDDIRLALAVIRRYQEDTAQKRPLSFLMLASPGAGKSHFIRCIAERLGAEKIGAVTYNMVGLQRHEDLIPPLDAARNFKVEDRLPLLFLDEFDAHDAHFPLLLPLLWDGQLNLGQHDLKLGKVVIVLAGSDPRLPGIMEHARSMKREASALDNPQPKLVDLLSRINGGVLRIPSLADPLRANERRADKMCIAVQLLRGRFEERQMRVPLALLRFVAMTEFRYGVRSIAHLIDLLPRTSAVKELATAAHTLPLDDAETLKSSSLAYHLLSDDQAHGVVKAWKDACKSRALVMISREPIDFFVHRLAMGMPPEYFLQDQFYLERVWHMLSERRPGERARGK